MTEAKDYVEIPEGTRGLKIKIDESEKDKIIAELNQKIGAQEDTIKSFLVRDRQELLAEQEKQKVIHDNNPKPAPTSTAPLNELAHFSEKIDLESSEILGLNPRFPNVESLVNEVKKRASEPSSPDYQLAQQLYGKMVKKTLKENATYEYKGNMARFERKGDRVVPAERKKIFVKVSEE
jgi:hypothetical protein